MAEAVHLAGGKTAAGQTLWQGEVYFSGIEKQPADARRVIGLPARLRNTLAKDSAGGRVDYEPGIYIGIRLANHRPCCRRPFQHQIAFARAQGSDGHPRSRAKVSLGIKSAPDYRIENGGAWLALREHRAANRDGMPGFHRSIRYPKWGGA
jgi:hypothetical protein